MDLNADNGYQTLWLVRRLFQRMALRSQQMLEPFGISVGERAVVEFLFPQHERTVSAMARERDVSRQHIQLLVNGLLDKGLVEKRENPHHRASPLIMLSAKGVALFKAVQRQEAQILPRLFEGIGQNELAITGQTLARLYQRMETFSDWSAP